MAIECYNAISRGYVFSCCSFTGGFGKCFDGRPCSCVLACSQAFSNALKNAVELLGVDLGCDAPVEGFDDIVYFSALLDCVLANCEGRVQ
jgi:hypothetical protein